MLKYILIHDPIVILVSTHHDITNDKSQKLKLLSKENYSNKLAGGVCIKNIYWGILPQYVSSFIYIFIFLISFDWIEHSVFTFSMNGILNRTNEVNSMVFLP